MKRLLLLTITFFSLSAIAQCNLNISWTSSVVGGNITFTNTSTGVPSSPQFAWLYDGQSSSLENPTFPYDSLVSQVCFAIYSLDTICEDSVCGPVGSPPCSLNLSWVSCVGSGNIGFNNTSTGMPTNAAFAWLYDGQSSSVEDPVFTYNPSATTVCFAVYDIDNPSCEDSICGNINDTCACNLNISWYSQVNGGNITFYNTSTDEPTMPGYAWLYDGQASNVENPTFPYNPSETQVCFAIDDLGSNMCEDSICGPINIDSTGCNLNIDYVSNVVGGNINFYSISTGVPQNASYWWDYGTQYSQDQNPTFVYDSTVTFVCLTISDSTGLCSDTLCGPMNFDSSAIVMNYEVLDFNIYPNPVDSELNISLNTENSNLQIRIYDMVGRLILSEQLTGTNQIVDVSYLDKGGYILYLVDPSNVYNFAPRKFLKQ